MVSPTITPPIKPGPAAAAIPSSAPNGSCASFIALAMIESSTSTWARAAISGTTPPKAACSPIWEKTTFDRMRPCPSAFLSTTAAAVSSQVVSMPRTIIGVLSGSGYFGAEHERQPENQYLRLLVHASSGLWLWFRITASPNFGNGDVVMVGVGVALEGHMTQSVSAVPFLRIGSRGS